MNVKKIIKEFIPPVLLKLYNKLRCGGQINEKYGWSGDYNSWENAQKKSCGYDSSIIIEKVKNALSQVRDGRAVFERDSVLFDKIEYSWIVLTGLLLAASKNGNKLNVIDFGGSLGSTFFQNKLFLNELDEVYWNVVEQKKIVELGKKEFENKNLRFYDKIENCLLENKSNVLLLLSVLQYIEDYDKFIEEILKYNFEYIILDRTPFSMENRDIITVQTVPPEIYEASYPSRILCYKKLCDTFKTKYKILFEDYSNEGIIKSDLVNIHFKGIIFKLKKQADDQKKEINSLKNEERN